jgi:hypothetical protein
MARGRGGHHVRLGLGGQQRIHANDGRLRHALELRQEGARGVQHREELQVQLLRPGRVVRAGKGRDPALARVVHEDGGRAQCRLAVACELPHLGGVQHVAGLGEQAGLGMALAQLLHGLVQAFGAAAAQGDARALRQQQIDRGQAYARRAARDDGRGVLELGIKHGRLLRAGK